MITTSPATNDLWLDDSELDAIVENFQRILNRPASARTTRAPFYVDYAERE